MQNIPASRCLEGKAPRAQLEAGWYVDADSSYVRSQRGLWLGNPGENRYVAVRTLKGRGRITLSDRELRVGAGSLALFPIRKLQTYHAEQEGWRFYWFRFLEETELPELTEPMTVSAWETGALEHCFIAFGSGSKAQCFLAENLFNYLLAQWLVSSGGHGKKDQLLLTLERGRQQGLTMGEIAREAGMSERSFRDAVHQATGLSPSGYMERQTMAAALDLLQTTAMSVGEIADCLGFSSPSYFTRVFQKHYGLPPRAVRKNLTD